jgi:hypothetical protein
MSTYSSVTSESFRVHNSILETIGRTPLVRFNRIAAHIACPLYAKVEFFNLGGSIKDRIVSNIIAEAEESGRLTPPHHGGLNIIWSSLQEKSWGGVQLLKLRKSWLEARMILQTGTQVHYGPLALAQSL